MIPPSAAGESAFPAETALITGASSGIGLELARCFAADGCRLVLAARREAALRELAVQLRAEHGIDAVVLPCDLSQPAAGGQLADACRQRELTIDILVNNAGFGAQGPFGQLPLDRQRDMVQVNAAALTELSRRFLPGMLERGRGGILNVASTAAFQPGPNMAVYFATKAFVLSLTEALAEELSGSGVAACCLCPGPTRTEFEAVAEMQDARLFRFGTMTARAVARAGHRGLRRGKVIVVPGLGNKFATWLVRFAPRFVVRKVAGWLVG